MFKNYFKVGFRSLKKNRLSSLINVGGLALAIGCCLMAFEFVDWATHLDTFHSKLDQLFVIERVADQNGNQSYYGNSPQPLGPMLRNDFPAVRQVARLNYEGVIIKQGDNVFRESVTFVDDAFYQMFDFPIKWGSKQDFTDPTAIVLTEELSEKLFGRTHSIGKTLSIRFSNNGTESVENFTVRGVLNKQPTETSFYFSALIPFQKRASLGFSPSGDWRQSADITFIEADHEKALLALQPQLKKYVDQYNEANSGDKISSFHFQALKAMNSHAYQVNRQFFNSMKPIGLIMLSVIPILILILVYFNYTNIAIASAANRLKEISVRKVMGSKRIHIVYQFIVENLIICTFAILIGLLLAKFFFLPWFSSIANIELGQKLFTNHRTWLALLVLIVVSAISGAAYPAFYISGFSPTGILKGNIQIGSKNRFRKGLLAFQFFLMFLAISTALAFVQETNQIKTKPWGYTPANTVVVKVDNASNYRVLAAFLKENSRIQSVTGSVQPLGNYTREISITHEGKPERIKSMSVLPGYLSQLGVKIIRGRDLSEAYATDPTSAIIVNQAFLKHMNWSSGIGKNISYEGRNYTIVGEANDFHYENFEHPVDPMVMMGCQPEEVIFAYVKTPTSSGSPAHTEVQNVWKKVNPDLPFEYYYQDSVFNGYFNEFAQVAEVLSVSSFIMAIISISGIFGLALIILNKKMKEISIRKVLGAGVGDIVYLINKEFFSGLVIAILVGSPAAIWLTGTLFTKISSASEVSFVPLSLAFIILVFTTAISVSWHIFKAHTANPTQYLKAE